MLDDKDKFGEGLTVGELVDLLRTHDQNLPVKISSLTHIKHVVSAKLEDGSLYIEYEVD